MSHVCDTILHMSCIEEEKDRLADVNNFFGSTQKGFVFLDSQDLPEKEKHWYGGSKVFQSQIALGAFNYLDIEGLKNHLSNIKWEYPEQVQLILKDEHDYRFSIWNLK